MSCDLQVTAVSPVSVARDSMENWSVPQRVFTVRAFFECKSVVQVQRIFRRFGDIVVGRGSVAINDHQGEQ